MEEIKKSTEYKYLEKRIIQLKKHFSFQQSINGITKLQSDRIRGLRLLCHAEFEDYFESVALKLLDKAMDKWNHQKIANYNLAALLVYHDKIDKMRGTQTKINKVIADYRCMIRDNHGIKEDNIKKMYEPLGYDIDDFEVAFLASLSSYGELRGEIAHSSVKHTQHSFDKNDEYTKIDAILEGILGFENVIKNI